MLKTLGVHDRRELALLLTIVALVAVTPMGREGTSAVVLASHRLLLGAIALGCWSLLKNKSEPEVCPVFVGLCGLALLAMLASILWNDGSRFDGYYRWYQHLFFGAGFLALAAFHRQSSVQWKRTVLWAVLIIDAVYVLVALFAGRRPLMGPFINPNYFASFLLVGFAGGLAIAQFEREIRTRIAGAALAAFFYYGITQCWSRGASIAAILTAGLSVVRFTSGRNVSRVRIALIVLVAVVVSAAASPILIRKFLDRGQLDPYNYQRPQLWMSALRVIGGHPVAGVGLGGYYHVSKKFSPPVEGTVARYLKRPGIAHSEYLQFAAECGIPAAILLFGLAGCTVFVAIRRARRCSAQQRVFQEASILVAGSLGLHALVDNNWNVPVMAAGLVVFSLAEVLPLREWRLPLNRQPRLAMAGALLLALVLIHGVAVPGLAVHFNERGLAAYGAGNLDAAESEYRLAAAVAPNHEVFLNNAGTVYFDKFMKSRDRRWLDYAETFFVKAMQANPNSEESGRHLENAVIQRLTGDPSKDRAVHERIAAIDRQILAIDPVNIFVRKNLAEALYNAGERDAAARQLEQAIALEPNYVPAYLRMSDWCRERGNAAASDDYRQRGLAIVIRYRDVPVKETYEAMLLGRPVRTP